MKSRKVFLLVAFLTLISVISPYAYAQYSFARIYGSHTAFEDVQAVNPKYHTADAYNKNCSHTVAAYEMRRRGYDVEATPAFDGDKYYVAGSMAWGFLNLAEAVDAGAAKWVEADTPEAILNEIETVILFAGDGARYEVRLKPSNSVGHFIVGENIDGVVVWLDPQSGKWGDSVVSLFQNATKENTWYLKIDDLRLDMDIMRDLCIDRGTQLYDPNVDYMARMIACVEAGDIESLEALNKARNAKILLENMDVERYTLEELIGKIGKELLGGENT